jgi:SagB-type dehydrogenase family enzyme
MTTPHQNPHLPPDYALSSGEQWACDLARRYFLEQWAGKYQTFATGQKPSPASPAWEVTWKGARIPLSRWFPASLCSVHDALSGDGRNEHVERSIWDRLSVVLRLGACVTRYEFERAWIPHRSYPSPGALFSTCVFVSLANHSQRRWYRLDPNRHELVTMRRSGLVKEISSGVPEATSFSLALVACCDRLEEKYGALSYRLACLEAGHLVESCSLLATALSLPFRISTGECDGGAQIVSLPGRATQSLMCLVEGGDVTEDNRSQFDREKRDTLSARSPQPEGTSSGAPADRPPRPVSLTEIEAAQAFSRGTSSSVLERRSFSSARLGTRSLPLDNGSPSLWTVLRDRSSGPSTLVVGRPPAQQPLLSSLRSVLDCCDWADESTSRPARGVYALVVQVADLPPGTYRWSPQPGSLELHVPGTPPADIVPHTEQLLSLDLFTCLVVLTVDLDGELRRRGSSTLRVLNLEAGAAAQRIALVATVHGMVTRPLVGCNEDRLSEHLGLLAKREDPLYALALAPATTGPFRVEVA